jgi:hypothetical protein
MLEPAHGNGEDGAPAIVEREGLPRGYRMRADPHYVDAVVAASSGQPVRMMPTAQIDCEPAGAAADLTQLIESIRAVGIVHPLLLRRANGRHAVVAGRKRFTVARILELPAVPCLIHEVDEAQAAVLAAADNLVVTQPATASEASTLVLAIRDVVGQHLATIRSCGDLAASGSPALARPVFDLIRAHAWRAARLGDALDLATGVPPRAGRERSLAAAMDEVVKGFEPESRLNGFALRGYVRGELSTSGLNDHDIVTGLSGAILAVLPLLEHSVRPSLLISGSAAGPSSVVLEVTQPDTPVSEHVARTFLDDESAGRPGGFTAVAGALAARALAARHSGTTAFEAGVRGSTLKLILARRS